MSLARTIQNSPKNAINALETTPLIQGSEDLGNDTVLHAKKPSTPIPWKQILTLCAFRIADPIAFSQILPYINDMLLAMKVSDDPSKVGFYSGIAESAFSVAVIVFIYPWARLSGTFTPCFRGCIYLVHALMQIINRPCRPTSSVALWNNRPNNIYFGIYAVRELSNDINVPIFG